ncbi:MAG: acyltransferase [Cyanobacteria bacterium]|nr:acyltransferase [Cyanobacteria bacterium CG_2015-16_32_12]NCO78204.1 acyltransferase [Cyanobacteria bacterium CG_2015-22_32_23]NCQ03590.1 acyltransferase [Cyanobacteria bacterium CG_2015-09_32_10]NCQ41930.1 acyltransferase [Cyanobacteria bacterium CG_2015-04_32_10]NCS85839.1 acyltransferase [Cyanobacteria bacterium CG_2015-02_32_10]
MQSTSPPSVVKKIVYLDYLRIFASLGVIACHLWVGAFLPNLNIETVLLPECLGIHGDLLYKCGLDTVFILPNDSLDHLFFNFFNLIFGMGYQGVHLFFILSGFGLTLSAFLSEKKTNRIGWVDFLKKRFSRLYPSYWIVLAIYLSINFYLYKSVLGLLKTYVLGSIFLNIIPATWFVPIILQLYLLFPLLFYFLKKLSIKNFLVISLIIKIVVSAIVITTSLLVFNKILGFGGGALAPGGFALTRLFEFCFGMAMAKYYVIHGFSTNALNIFRQPYFILLGFFLQLSGFFLSLKYSTITFYDHNIPVGIFLSDALIGVGIFILSLNLMFFIDYVFKRRSLIYLDLISNASYEAYLVHGMILSVLSIILIKPVFNLLSSDNNYFIICFLYLIFLLIFSFITYYCGIFIFNLKSFITKKINL